MSASAPEKSEPDGASPAATTFFLRLGAEVRGPLGMAQLRQLAEVDLVTPASEVAMSREGPWLPLGTRPECAAICPPRTEHRFKTNEFETLNVDGGAPVNHRDFIAAANRPSPTSAATRARDPAGENLLAAAARARAVPAPPNEVQTMVQEVAAVEARLAPPAPILPRRGISRRMRHYLILALAGNAALAAIPIYFGGPFDVFETLVFEGWFVLFNGGLATVMFVHVKKY